MLLLITRGLDDTLPGRIDALRGMLPTQPITVIDNGGAAPAPATLARLHALPGCALCRHPEPYGRGACIKTGIAFAREGGWAGAFLVVEDENGWSPPDIAALSDAMCRRPDSLLLGNRGDVRGIPARCAIQALGVHSEGRAFDFRLVLAALRAGLRVSRLPAAQAVAMR